MYVFVCNNSVIVFHTGDKMSIAVNKTIKDNNHYFLIVKGLAVFFLGVTHFTLIVISLSHFLDINLLFSLLITIFLTFTVTLESSGETRTYSLFQKRFKVVVQAGLLLLAYSWLFFVHNSFWIVTFVAILFVLSRMKVN